jgi:hypothetical protein
MNVVHRTPEGNQSGQFTEADFDGYQAAPLLIVGSRARASLITNQDRLAYQFGEIAKNELSEYVEPSVVQFVSHSIIARMHQREGLNGNEYIRRLHKFPHVWAVPNVGMIEAYKASQNALIGTGTITKNDIARRAFGMAAIEYSNLTMIGTFRKQLEQPMWDDIGELLGVDATPHYNQMKNLKVLAFDRDITEHSRFDAMRISMKRDLGTTDDGTELKARTFAIINTAQNSPIERVDIRAIRTAALEKVHMSDVPEFRQLVHWLVDEALPKNVVLARNETVYGTNQATHDAIAVKRRYAQRNTTN